MKYFRLALSLLTILPAGSLAELEPGDSGRAAIWYPLVGVIIGFITAVGWGVSRLFFPLLPTSILTLVLWVILTGALHLDGLADCCDGLLSAASPERRLKIMADPHIGTFGVVGLILILLLKLGALYSLDPTKTFFILIFASTISRWFVLLAGKQPLARPEGMAADFSAGLSDRSNLMAALIPVALIFFGGWEAAIAAAVASLAAVGIISFARARIGGVTGDVFGLIIEISEVMVLLTYAAL
jgi:adenosylcobinamide-GDP ribazoletransferase